MFQDQFNTDNSIVICKKEPMQKHKKQDSESIADSEEQVNQQFQLKLHNYELIFKDFVSLLLGKSETLETSVETQKKRKQIVNQQSPAAILIFANPDHPGITEMLVNTPQLQQIELFELLKQSIHFEKKSIKDSLLLKAIESVYLKLQSIQFNTKKKDKHKLNFNLPTLNLRGIGTTMRSDKQNTLINQKSDLTESIPQSNRDLLVLITSHFSQLFQNLSKEQHHQKYVQEILNLNFRKLKKTKLKKYHGGGYHVQNFDKWIRSNQDTADVLTLIRNSLLLILSLRGFEVQSSFSSDGKQIICQLFTDENGLKNMAEIMKMQKKVNFHFSDILSLEPVDSSLRPLRLSNRLWKPSEYNLSEMFLYLRPLMIKLIESINYKRLSRETNSSGLNQKLFQYGLNDCYEDDESPTEEQWTAFYEYLVHSEKSIVALREDIRLDSDVASLINNEQSPLQLYQNRNKNNKEIQALNHVSIYEDINSLHLMKINQLKCNSDDILMQYKPYMLLKQIPEIKYIRILQKQQKAYNYKLKFLEALNVANKGKKILQNIWNMAKIDPQAPYGTFVQQNKNSSLSQKMKFHQLWCQHQVTEEGQISLFSSTEKLKLVHHTINTQVIDINNLIQEGFIEKFLCIHDNYELLGQCDNLYNIISAAPQFYQKKQFNLKEMCQFTLRKPHNIEYKELSSYFGEKIGLYFYFASYLIYSLIPISLIGMVFSMIQWIIWDQDNAAYVLVNIVFAFIQAQWDNFFTDLWEQKQNEFRLMFGQNRMDQKSILRSQFEGCHKRSISNDQMNSLEVKSDELYKRMAIASALLILIIGAYTGIVVGLFAMSMSVKENPTFDTKVPALSFEVTMAATLNVLLLLIIEQYYDRIASALTNFENHKTVSIYETSFIVKKYIFYFFAYIGPLLFIAFLNSPLKLYCYQNNCQKHVQYHFSTLIILIISFKIGLNLYKIYKCSKIPNKIYSKEEMLQFIINESEKIPLSDSADRYGIMEKYLEFFIFLAMLSMFGYTFPMSYLIFLVHIIIQIHTDQYLMINHYQRPWPQNEASIGIWDDVMQIISMISLLSNSGVITVYYNRKYGYQLILVFVSIVMLNSMIKFLIESTCRGIPQQLISLIQRHAYLISSTLHTFISNRRGKGSATLKELRKYPIHKIYGVKNNIPIGEYETLSSQADLEDHYQEIEIRTKITQKTTRNQILQKNQNQEESPEVDDLFQEAIQIVIKNPPKELLFLHYNNRPSNWAFRIQLNLENNKLLPKIKLKAYNFLYKLELLNNYRRLWTEQRMSSRFFYIRRKQQLVKNLDWRKYRMFIQNQRIISGHVQKLADNKFRKKLKALILEEDTSEYEQLVDQQDRFIEKNIWLLSRKVIVFKAKAIWFGGFRKGVMRQKSLKIMEDYYKRTKFLDSLKKDSNLYDQFEAMVNYQKLREYDIPKTLDLLRQLKHNPKIVIEIPLTCRFQNPINYYLQQQKSPTYLQIIDKLRDTYIFDIQTKKLEEIILTYFQEELLPIEDVRLTKLIMQDMWLAIDSADKKCLIQLIQLKMGTNLEFMPEINPKFGITYPKCIPQGRLSNIVDQIDDFYIKGYCCCKYPLKGGYSLRQILKYRDIHGLFYSQTELLQFIHANLKLFQIKPYGSLNLDSYYYNDREYILINPNPILEEPDIFNLAIVVLQMILLRPIVDPQLEYEELQHPLKRLIYDMLFEENTVEQILMMVNEQTKFIEMEIPDDRKSQLNLNLDFENYLQLALNKINFYFRMKHHSSLEKEIRQFESVLYSQILKVNDNGFTRLLENLIEHINTHLLDSKILKQNTQILLIFYLKYASYFEQRKLYQLEIEQIIKTLEKILRDIKIIERQLYLKVNTENLSESRQKIILHQRSSSVQDLKSIERIHLLKQLKKHQDHIEVLTQYKKSIQRFSNQFNVLKTLRFYFKQQYLQASHTIEDIIGKQIKITAKQEQQQITEEPEEFNPNFCNFDQYSPKHTEENENKEILLDYQEQITEDPNYVNQLLYYKYLQLLIWFDQGNELFDFYLQDYLNLKLEYPTYLYFVNQLLIICKQFELSSLNMESQCYLGKYILINAKRWMGQQQQLIESNDTKYMWRQLMNYTDLIANYHNRNILLKYVAMEVDSQAMIIQQIRAIHLLLHIDGYIPVTQFYIPSPDNFSNINFQYFSNSYIYQLQRLHHQISIESYSWFHNLAINKLKIFYLKSITFTFTSKHLENIEQKDSLLNLANYSLSILAIETAYYSDIMQNAQILQKSEQKLLMGSDNTQLQKYQILNSFIYISQRRVFNIYNFYEQVQEHLEDEQFQSSIFMLMLIQFYINCQEFEFADILIIFCKKLISSNVPMFETAHDGFQNDLQLLELQMNQNNLEILRPYNALLMRNKSFKHYNDIVFYSQLVIYNIFYSHNFEINLEHIDYIFQSTQGNEKIANLNKIYQLFDVLTCCQLGEDFLEKWKATAIVLTKQNTLLNAILSHLLCRIYINLNDYEHAQQYSEFVLSFIYSLQVQQCVILNIQKRNKIYFHNVQKTYIPQLMTPQFIEIQQEGSDYLYQPLLDEQFINVSILCYLDIAVNINNVFPPITIILQLLRNQTEDFDQAYLLAIIAQLFRNLSTADGLSKLSAQLINCYKLKILEIEKEKKMVKKRQFTLGLLNKLTQEEVDNAKNRINILNYQLNIFQSYENGLDHKLVLSWSIQAAEKSIAIYKNSYWKQFKQKHNPYVGKLFILISENYRSQQLLVKSINFMSEAEDELAIFYGRKTHPLKGYFFLKQCLLKRSLYEQFIEQTKKIISIPQFTNGDCIIFVKQMIQMDRQLLGIFDQFQFSQSENNLQHQLGQFLQRQEKQISLSTGQRYEEKDAKTIIDQLLQQFSQFQLNGIQEIMNAQHIFTKFEQYNQYTTAAMEILSKCSTS